MKDLKHLFHTLICFFFFISASCLFSEDDVIVVPFELNDDNRIVIKANINGTDGRFMWDTGALFSMLNVPFEDLPFLRIADGGVYGATNPMRFYELENKIKINGVTINSKSETTGIPYNLQDEGLDGILSIAVFDGYWCEVSFSKMQIILYRKKPDAFTKSVPAKFPVGENFSIPVEIDGKNYDFVVDTGMYAAFGFPEAIILKKQKNDYTTVLSNGIVKKFHLVKTQSIKILGDTFTDKMVKTNSVIVAFSGDFWRQVIPPAAIYACGMLGVEFLRHYDLLFDLTQVQSQKTTALYYAPILPAMETNFEKFDGGFVKRVPPSGVLSLGDHASGYIVQDILEDGVAHKFFGLEPGMIVLQLNGKDVKKMQSIDFQIEFDNPAPGYEYLVRATDGSVRLLKNKQILEE